jgi:hypothetical protein
MNRITVVTHNCNDTGIVTSGVCIWYASRQQKSYKIMKTKMFLTLEKAKPDTGNSKGLNLAAVMFTTVQVSRLSLWRQLIVSSRA